MRFKGVLFFTGILLAAAAAVPRSYADTLTFTATLAGSSEVGIQGSAATGFGTVTVNGNILTVDESFSGLTAPALAAHIHCCAPASGTAPVVIPFTGFPNATSGTYAHTFDLSTFAFGGGLNETSFLTGLEAGDAYLNIHDVNFPAGEIRGQLTAATPEPTSLMLLGTGAVGMLGTLRRRKASY